jgi:peroxiredoxin
MKKTMTLAFIAILSIVSCTDSNEPRLVINGTLAEGVSADKVYLQKFDEKLFFVIDSATVVDGAFHFSTPVPLPEIYGLSVDTLEGTWQLFLDASPVAVTLDPAERYHHSVISGSAEQDLYAAYLKQENVVIDEFIKAHPQSLVAAYVLYRNFSYRLTAEEIQANILLLDSSLWNTQYVKTLEQLIQTLQAVAVGKPAPDFTTNDTEGHPVSLSSHLGKGYLLLDFWASWCPPCRRDNPLLVAVHDKYKGKGFDVFSVSLDKTKEAWLKGIEDDHLAWTHVSDILYWHSKPAQLYGVRAIPSSFLINPEGVIVARNLKPEDLDKTLAGFLK